jgi:hypothetical protein
MDSVHSSRITAHIPVPAAAYVSDNAHLYLNIHMKCSKINNMGPEYAQINVGRPNVEGLHAMENRMHGSI